MRTITVFNRLTLDGMYAGPDGEVDWFVHDPQLDKDVFEGGAAGTQDSVLFGRVTYEMFDAYWPQVAAGESPMGVDTPEERHIAQALTTMTKIVVSHQPRQFAWENTEQLSGDLVPAVRQLKAQDGDGIIMFGSGTVIQQLADADLIDDYFVVLTPVVLGAGKAQFDGVPRATLSLVSAKSYDSGNVLLHYRPVHEDS